MTFEKVRAGEYRAKLNEGTCVWVVRKGNREWVWFLGGNAPNFGVWETDDNGPFQTLKEAIQDAANYEEFLS